MVLALERTDHVDLSSPGSAKKATNSGQVIISPISTIPYLTSRLDEFIEWCRVLGTEPYICLNMGTGTLEDALGWLEYCNGSGNTHYANLRRKNGHDAPYGVKYWSLGNEVWGPWQVGQMESQDYAKKAFQWAKALRLLDPSIQLISCGGA